MTFDTKAADVQTCPRGSLMASRFGGLCLIAIAGTAGASEFESTVSVGVTNTDNVTLAPVRQESANVLLFRPGFTYTQDSSKLTADVAYRMDAYRYKERSENKVYNLLNADISFGMVPDRLFLDFGGSRSQTTLDPEGTIAFDNLAITSNRVNRDDLYAGPSFQVPVGDDVLVNGDFRRTWVRYGDELSAVGTLKDYESDAAGLSVDNYRKGVGLSWAARYVYQNVDYGLPLVSPYRYQQAYAELGYWVGEGTRLFVAAGKESPWDRPLDSTLSDTFWEAGVARQAGERFRAELAVGDRSFGSSWRGKLDYDFNRGTVALSYNETPTTSANDRFSGTGLLDPEQPNDYLFRAGSAERYIAKRLEWSLNLKWERYDFTVSLFDESRNDRTQVNGAPLANEQQSGANLSAAWRPGSRTELHVRAMRADRKFADGKESNLAATTAGVTYRLGRQMRLSFELERREQAAQTAALSYRENLASVVFVHTF